MPVAVVSVETRRVDFKASKGGRFVGQSCWEVRVDTTTGEVLQVADRRSDVIESIHDGGFFADWAKLYLFLPAGILLLLLWLTGLYLFFLPDVKRWQKHK